MYLIAVPLCIILPVYEHRNKDSHVLAPFICCKHKHHFILWTKFPSKNLTFTQQMEWMNDWFLSHDSAMLRLHWAGDNMGEWDDLCYEWCSWRIDRSTCWPAVQRATTAPQMPPMNGHCMCISTTHTHYNCYMTLMSSFQFINHFYKSKFTIALTPLPSILEVSTLLHI